MEWSGVVGDNIDNENVNSEIVKNEIVNSIDSFRVSSSNNSGNDVSSSFNIHSDSENYDSSDDESLQKSINGIFYYGSLIFSFSLSAFEVLKDKWINVDKCDKDKCDRCVYTV